MKPPIIVIDESNYVDFYASVEDAEASMEPVDIADGIYKVYDSEGYPLEIDVSNAFRRKNYLFFSIVDTLKSPKLRDFAERKSNEKELISILKSFCEKNLIPVDDSSSLSDILNVVKENGRIIPSSISRR